MIFSGNIKKAISRYLIYKIGAGRICTFDDGLGNIVGKGYFYEKKENFFSFLFFMIFQRDMLYANIRNKINTHYTIYDARNAYHEMAENIVRINLLGNSFLSLKCKKTEKKPQEIVIYLGTVFDVKSSVGKRAKSNIDNFVLKFFNVDFYLPHPRESTKLIHSKLIKNTVHCPIIAEEFVANKALSGYSLTLIMSNSSAGVNIKSLNIPGVSVLNVYHPTFQPNTSRLMEDFDIKSLRIDPKDS